MGGNTCFGRRTPGTAVNLRGLLCSGHAEVISGRNTGRRSTGWATMGR